MSKINKHIQIVSSELSWLSSMSTRSQQAVHRIISKYYTHVHITTVNSEADLEKLVATKPDLVFLGVEFVPARSSKVINAPKNIWVSDYLESHGIACTGSARIAHLLQRDKPLAKQSVIQAGLKTAPYFVVRQDAEPEWSTMKLPYPLFVKPTNRGGGLGIDEHSVVNSLPELITKVHGIASEHGSDSLIEAYLDGREFSVGIIKNILTGTYVAMPIELIAAPSAAGLRVLGGAEKSLNIEEAVAIIDLELKTKISELALGCFHAIGARDYGRIDIRLDENGIPHFLEANLIPSLIFNYGSFPKSCVINLGLNQEDMILQLVSLGFMHTLSKQSVVPHKTLITPIETGAEPALVA